MSRRERREAIEGYIAISPWAIGLVVFVAGPLVASFVLSFSEWSLLSPPKFVGPRSYVDLFADPLFWQSLKVTSVYAVFQVPLSIAVGLSVALVLNQRIRGLSLWRTMYYLQSIVSGVAVAMLWVWVLHPEFGLLNMALSIVGVHGPNWLGSRSWALPSLIGIALWNVGGGMLIYLAGLQNIPTHLYDAASIDGAGVAGRFCYITVPMMTPILFYQLVLGVIGSLQVFTEAFVMTAGGPGNATLFYVLYLYRNAFQYFKMGKASAMAWVLALIIMALTLALFKTSGRWVYYETGGDERW